MTALTLNLDRVHLSDEQFYQLCQNNGELNFERTARGELIIINPQQQQKFTASEKRWKCGIYPRSY
jgi:Uma2 family endonuclease